MDQLLYSDPQKNSHVIYLKHYSQTQNAMKIGWLSQKKNTKLISHYNCKRSLSHGIIEEMIEMSIQQSSVP